MVFDLSTCALQVRMSSSALVLAVHTRLTVKLDKILLHSGPIDSLTPAPIAVENKWLVNRKHHRGGATTIASTAEVNHCIFIELSIWKSTPFFIVVIAENTRLLVIPRYVSLLETGPWCRIAPEAWGHWWTRAFSACDTV